MWPVAERTDTQTVRQGLPADLVKGIVLGRAQDLARIGHFGEAESLISALSHGKGAAPACLDLMAKIRAQQGRYADAEAYWVEASRLEPDNEAHRAGLLCIARERRISALRSAMRALLIALLLLTVAGVIGYAVVRPTDGARDELKSESIPVVEQAKPTGSAARRSAFTDIKIDIQGIATQAIDGDILLTFTSGIFVAGATVKPEAKLLLRALGRQLGPHSAKIMVQVVGFTDDLPLARGATFRDNDALGLRRAVTVAEYLRVSAGLPSSIFSIRSLGEASTPYPNDSRENRARNRTVTIRISTLGQ